MPAEAKAGAPTLTVAVTGRVAATFAFTFAFTFALTFALTFAFAFTAAPPVSADAAEPLPLWLSVVALTLTGAETFACTPADPLTPADVAPVVAEAPADALPVCAVEPIVAETLACTGTFAETFAVAVELVAVPAPAWTVAEAGALTLTEA
jgi:hypothetical protein